MSRTLPERWPTPARLPSLVKALRLSSLLPGLDDPDPEGFRDPGAEQAVEEAPKEDPSADPGPAAAQPLAIPFGPFIGLAALEWLLFEPLWMRLFDRFIFGGLAGS